MTSDAASGAEQDGEPEQDRGAPAAAHGRDHARQLEHEPGAARGGGGQQPSAVARGDVGGDRQAATAAAAPGAGAAGELGDRRGQARPLVGDLDAHAVAALARAAASTRPPPCSSAFATRLPIACASRSAVAADDRPGARPGDATRSSRAEAPARPSATSRAW